MSQNNVIDEGELPKDIFLKNNTNYPLNEFHSLKEMVRKYEISVIEKAVRKFGSVVKASKILKVAPSTLYRKLQK